METFKYIKMKPDVDIRQSDKWAQYLENMGWKYHRTSRGINICYRKTFFGSVVKIQKPVSITDSDIEEIERFCKGYKPIFIKIEPFIGQDISVLEKRGYKPSSEPLTPPSTSYIDLTKSEEELWKNISRSGRYSIRKAEKANTITRFYQNPPEEKLNLYFEIVRETGRRKHFYVQPIKDLKNKVKVFGKDSHLALSFDQNGNLLSGKFFLCFDDMVLYSTAGTSEMGLKTEAGYELLWRSILYFKGLGYKILDLEGIYDPRFEQVTKNWGGFSLFKEKFGGEKIEFPCPYIKYFSPFFKILSKFSELSL
mgnify:FL=1